MQEKKDLATPEIAPFASGAKACTEKHALTWDMDNSPINKAAVLVALVPHTF